MSVITATSNKNKNCVYAFWHQNKASTTANTQLLITDENGLV